MGADINIRADKVTGNVVMGKKVIEKQKAKEERLAEFAKAVEFESRNKRAKR
ncbi:hypothetical protein [Polynucleobacter asymbioticus]|jgi:hypothetical protein|uniref:hypothetical protein n=1 Tax=Polynucleobacter asymbioticus TaxID=576611 RepID=UPI0012DB583D|nr:hypothetical protein [Polynucleobacter asymbioticus]